MSPSRILDASTEFYYNFYVTAVVIDSTYVCLTFHAVCTHANSPGRKMQLTWIDDIRGFISDDV